MKRMAPELVPFDRLVRLERRAHPVRSHRLGISGDLRQGAARLDVGRPGGLLRPTGPDGSAGCAEVSMNNRLKVLRAERNWSQAELAQRLDVSRQSVNAIETGKYDPSLPLAFRIARLFGLSLEQIFSDEVA